MAGIDMGSHGARRAQNHEIPLLPFIDFLLCLVMFLLVTAVWSQLARVEVGANVPSREEDSRIRTIERELHVDMKNERAFKLLWKEGAIVVSSSEVPRRAVALGDGSVTYPELARKIEGELRSLGAHRVSLDSAPERAVLHSDNSTEFAHLVAVLDAIHASKKRANDRSNTAPAFHVVFASD